MNAPPLPPAPEQQAVFAYRCEELMRQVNALFADLMKHQGGDALVYAVMDQTAKAGATAIAGERDASSHRCEAP